MREQDLAAVTGSHNAGDAVEGVSGVFAAVHLGRASVNAHAYLDRTGTWVPSFASQGALGGDGSFDRLGGDDEGGFEGIADQLEYLAAVLGDGCVQDGV